MPQGSPSTAAPLSSPPEVADISAGDNFSGQRPPAGEDRDPGQLHGAVGPLHGEDQLAGVSPTTTHDAHDAQDEWDTKDMPTATGTTLPDPEDIWSQSFVGVNGAGMGVAGTCWVCGRDFQYNVTDFEPDGPHRVCAMKARRMEASFAAQRRSAAESFNVWTARW